MTEQPRGRRISLTPELGDALCAARRNGHSITGAAAACGIGRSTLHRWLQEGEAEDAPDELRDFWDRFTRAGATMFGELISAAFQDAIGGVETERGTRPDGTEIVKVTPPNGKIALELLSRLSPDDWRPVKAIEVSGPNQGPVEVTAQAEIVESILGRVAAAKERRQQQPPVEAWGGQPVTGADDHNR